jgi:hypothetical protein
MIHTSSGCRLFLGPVAGTSVDTEADFEALSFTEISQIQDLGEFGDVAEDLTFGLVNDERLHYRKGSVDAGVIPLVLSYDPDGDGPAALKAASASRDNYAFKIEFGGTPGVPPAEEVFYSNLAMISWLLRIFGERQPMAQRIASR